MRRSARVEEGDRIGIGLFIAFIGLYNLARPGREVPTPVDLTPFTNWTTAITIVGLLITIGLRAMGFPGDLLIGIILTTAFATIVNYAADVYPENLGYARWPDDIFQRRTSASSARSASTGSRRCRSSPRWRSSSRCSADFFDTMGTLVGVGRQAGYLDERGEMPEIGKPLLVDSAAAAAGGFASASSATTYIESASGVGVGGRTGWVSVVTGRCSSRSCSSRR